MGFKISNKATAKAPVSSFGLGSARKPNKKIHGGKGAGLIQMSNMGLPVPPGFVIQVPNFHAWKKDPTATEVVLQIQVKKTLERIQKAWGDEPLLFSVRSGAEVSMPGMMDTVLNVGATKEWTKETALGGSPEEVRWALDCRRRFLQMFGEVVNGQSPEAFEKVLEIAREEAEVETDSELSADQLDWVVSQFEDFAGDIPSTLPAQLMACIKAVFESWDNPRAIEYRNQNNIPDDLGTAVTIQAMAFGNLGETSGSGVCFSRCPSTGECKFVVEYLANAQGEDVVAGVRTPMNGTEFLTHAQVSYQEIQGIAKSMEEDLQDMVDMEFTIQNGKLWVLQVRAGKRTGAAAFRIALDMWEQGIIDVDDIRKRLRSEDLDAATQPRVKAGETKEHTNGLAASPGVARGVAVTTLVGAAKAMESGVPFIWVAKETNPNHIAIMGKAAGILTEVGGITSHAAVVARGMNKPCITACATATKLDGCGLTLDGSSGKVWLSDKVEIEEGGWSEDILRVMTLLYEHDGSRFSGPEMIMDGQWVQCGHWFKNPLKKQGARALESLALGKFQDVVLDLTLLSGPKEDLLLANALGGNFSGKDEERRTKLVQYLEKNAEDLSGRVAISGGSLDQMKLLKAVGYKLIRSVSVQSNSTMGYLLAAIEDEAPVFLTDLTEEISAPAIQAMIPKLKLVPPTKPIADLLGG